jgi:hypothetical protein
VCNGNIIGPYVTVNAAAHVITTSICDVCLPKLSPGLVTFCIMLSNRADRQWPSLLLGIFEHRGLYSYLLPVDGYAPSLLAFSQQEAAQIQILAMPCKSFPLSVCLHKILRIIEWIFMKTDIWELIDKHFAILVKGGQEYRTFSMKIQMRFSSHLDHSSLNTLRSGSCFE